ncbi:MAG TPA: hypothetical protein VI278_14080 [Nitrososphaeraceae archaeon]
MTSKTSLCRLVLVHLAKLDIWALLSFAFCPNFEAATGSLLTACKTTLALPRFKLSISSPFLL